MQTRWFFIMMVLYSNWFNNNRFSTIVDFRIASKKHRCRFRRVYDEAVLRQRHILLEDPEGKRRIGRYPNREFDHVDRYRMEAERSGSNLSILPKDWGSTEGRTTSATGAEIGTGRWSGTQVDTQYGIHNGIETGTTARARIWEIGSKEEIGQRGHRDITAGSWRHCADQRDLSSQREAR